VLDLRTAAARRVAGATRAPARLVECGATSDDGAGWRAALAPDEAGVDALEVPIYCPSCWAAEFSGDEGDEG
jgi:hypothetical protein